MRIRYRQMAVSAAVNAIFSAVWFVRGDAVMGSAWLLATLVALLRSFRDPPPNRSPEPTSLRATGLGFRRFFSGWPPSKDDRDYR